jgi:hypothetical protein
MSSCTQLNGRYGNRLIIDQTTVRDLVVGVHDVVDADYGLTFFIALELRSTFHLEGELDRDQGRFGQSKGTAPTTRHVENGVGIDTSQCNLQGSIAAGTQSAAKDSGRIVRLAGSAKDIVHIGKAIGTRGKAGIDNGRETVRRC